MSMYQSEEVSVLYRQLEALDTQEQELKQKKMAIRRKIELLENNRFNEQQLLLENL